jgi:hypothetical protein
MDIILFSVGFNSDIHSCSFTDVLSRLESRIP